MQNSPHPRDMVAKYSELASSTKDAILRSQYMELAARYLELAETSEIADSLEDRQA